jgi:hypothetical protein
MEPELNGRPIELTKNISEALKKRRILGANNLKIINNMPTETTLAITKFFIVIVL